MLIAEPETFAEPIAVDIGQSDVDSVGLDAVSEGIGDFKLDVAEVIVGAVAHGYGEVAGSDRIGRFED